MVKALQILLILMGSALLTVVIKRIVWWLLNQFIDKDIVLSWSRPLLSVNLIGFIVNFVAAFLASIVGGRFIGGNHIVNGVVIGLLASFINLAIDWPKMTVTAYITGRDHVNRQIELSAYYVFMSKLKHILDYAPAYILGGVVGSTLH